jgi:hypothetical protein
MQTDPTQTRKYHFKQNLTPLVSYPLDVYLKVAFCLYSPTTAYTSQPKGAWDDGPWLLVQITAPGSVGVMEGSTWKISVT